MTDDRYGRPDDAARRLAELRAGGKRPADPPPPEADEGGGEGDESFSLRSADRRQKVMLELRFKTGDATALAYSLLVRADLNPSREIVLEFAAHEVRIAGRNLRPLFAGIVAQRVAFVQEVDDLQAEAAARDAATVVTGIAVAARADG